NIDDHLREWALRRFESDEAYFQWQRESLSSEELKSLHKRVEIRRNGSQAEDVAFYDATADPRILPVLYSQRYGYFTAIGSRVISQIGDARRVLDFGCGVGILTTYYACRFPSISFVGIDRSPLSIARAQEQADALGLQNVQFQCLGLPDQTPPGLFDLIVATHSLVQAEQDPGIPSRDWSTFERVQDAERQRQFEERTGIGPRLDRLCEALHPQGRLILFEKTRQLARRIPFQRALAARQLSLIEEPAPIRYQIVEEVTDDGLWYVLDRGPQKSILWDESPEPDEGPPFDSAALESVTRRNDEPLYENHYPSAQHAWERLRRRLIVQERTTTEPDGRQLHVELGQSEEGRYLYCANTYDQRQLVLFEPARASMLERYYREIVGA
ncbi:MAG TPA: methyltransferase domain-containing protein, partial [Nitrospira sp.]